jgi:phage FluMu protein Com
MEVRCGKCNKLFRVSDDKITGSGIKFACSRCGEYVKITQEDFERYNLSKAAAPVPASHEPKPAKAAPGSAKDKVSPAPAAPIPSFDLGEPRAGEPPHKDEAPPAFVKPAPPNQPVPAPAQPKAGLKGEPKKEPGPAAPVMRPTEPKPATAPKPGPIAAPRPVPAASSAPAGHAAQHAATMSAALPSASSGTGKKLAVFIAVILVIILAALFGAKWYFGQASQRVSDAVKAVTAPEGLQIASASGAIEPGTQDLIITGVIENTTDKPRPAWYVVADVYDAQNSVLVRAKLLSGKQLYTRRDYDILAKRGVNIEELKKKYQEQGVIIPPKGTVSFEIRVMEPPVGVASFNATLQPFDPVKLFKEMVEEQKQQ